MKKIIFSVLVLSAFSMSAIAGSWQWAKKHGGTSADESNGIAVDLTRNSYVTGNFSGTATFGSTSLVSGGGTDGCLSKIDEDGNYIWSIKVGTGTGNEKALAVVCDPGGSEIYVTGTFYGTSTFGTSTVLTSFGDKDIFIAKYNASGTLQWAVKAGGPYLDEVGDLAWAPMTGGGRGSYVYITGTFNVSATFGSTNLTAVNFHDIYTASYSDAGTLQWVNQATASSVVSNGIATDASNNVYITGGYYGTGTFGSVTLASGTSQEQFLVKYNSSGAAQWGRKGSGMSNEEGIALCTDGAGNVYVTGNYTSSSTTFGSYSVTNSGSTDISLVKYNSSGTEQWAKKGGGSGADLAAAITRDAWDNIYLTGTFQSGLMYFGTLSFGGDCPTDGYVVKADALGNFTEVSSPTGLMVPPANYPHIYPNDIVVSALGHIFIAGSFDVKFDFFSTIILSNGSTDGFVARLKPAGWPVVEGGAGGGTSYDVILNMDADVDGYTYVTGAFQGTLTIGNTMLVAGNGNHNMFLIKYDQLGQPVWAKKGTVPPYPAPPSYSVYGTAVVADASGNVFVAGEYNGTPTFNSTTLTGPAGIFLNKYDASGNLLWCVKAATQSQLEDMTLDASGNIYLTGDFLNTTTFGTGGGAVPLTATGTSKDGYIAKYDNSGNIVWAVNAVTTSGNSDFCYGIAVNGSNLFVVGSYSANGTIAGTSVTYAGGTTDMYIAKYSTAGAPVGVFTASSSNAESLFEIATTGGSIYVTGDYTGSLTFGSTSLTSSGSQDAVLAKLPTSLSSVTWVREVKGASSQKGRGVDVSGTSVYVSGDFVNSTTFGDGTTSPVIVPYGADVFVEKFDQNGTYQWVSTIERDGYGGPRMAIDANNNAYVAGLFINHLAVGSFTYSTTGDENFFIQKLSFDDGQFARLAAEETETETMPVNPLTVYPNPFSDFAVFEVPSNYEGNYTLVICDINGREAARQSGVLGAPVLFSREGLAPGLYMYTIIFDTEKPATGKLIVE